MEPSSTSPSPADLIESGRSDRAGCDSNEADSAEHNVFDPECSDRILGERENEFARCPVCRGGEP